MKKQKTHFLTALFLLMAATGWTQATIPYFSVLSPDYLVSLYQQNDGNYGTALFGPGVENGDVTGEVIRPQSDLTFCTPDGTDFTGKIALIDRGTCTFIQKVANAEANGAIAVIIANFDNSTINMANGDTSLQPTIPVIIVTKNIADAIRQALAQGETVTAAFSNAPLNFGLIEGGVRRDANGNCTADAGETPLRNWMVAAQSASGSVIVRTTDSLGHYKIFADTAGGPYTVFVLPPNPAWSPCPASATVNMTTPDTVQADFAVDANYECVELQTEISSPLLRRCFDNFFVVNVCNNGTETAAGAYADLSMAAGFNPITDASLPFTTLSDDTYRFDLGDVGPGECVLFNFRSAISCDDVELGQTLCYSVHAFPDTTCIQSAPAWSGANVSVTGVCEGDSVRFTIANTGTATMDGPQDYVIIEDDVMRQEGQFQLNPGQFQVIKVPASGATWRLETSQEPGHPFPGFPSVSLEGCTTGNDFSTGYFLMFPQYQAGYAVDEECQEVIGSYDPNDKRGLPLGFGPSHLIRPNTPLEYLIRFQNTGTDTAFTVVVRDTLPAGLDAASIRLGASSHPYQFERHGDNILIFRFNDIRLVDSFTNEPGSNGFLSFTIDQQPDLDFGTAIRNSAAIYFDFNPPVITNQTDHEVGYVIGVVTLASEPGGQINKAIVFPNPAPPGAVLQIRGEDVDNAGWRLFDGSGRQWGEGWLEGRQLRLPRKGLPAGMFTLELRSGAGKTYFVKLLVP